MSTFSSSSGARKRANGHGGDDNDDDDDDDAASPFSSRSLPQPIVSPAKDDQRRWFTAKILPMFLSFVLLLFILTCLANSRYQHALTELLLSSSDLSRQAVVPVVSPSSSTLPSLHRRVVAIADIHGSLPNLLTILSMSHLITQPPSIATSDPSAVWSPTGADDILVSTGDNVDRGDDTAQIYQLWEHLRQQAGADKVKTCLGNHEVMNALGDWRYVTSGDIKSFGGEAARRQAMSSRGWIGKNWLQHYNLSYTIDLLDAQKVQALQRASTEDHLPPLPSSYVSPSVNFVHGGFHPSFTARYSLEELNAISHSFMTKALDAAAEGTNLQGHLPPGTTQEEMAIWSADGPYWYRGYSYEKEIDACQLAKEAMSNLDIGARGATSRQGEEGGRAAAAGPVGQFVMGHTPTFEHFVHRCPPRYQPSTPTDPVPPLRRAPLINLIDTGISPAYSGVLSSLVFETWLELRWTGNDEEDQDEGIISREEGIKGQKQRQRQRQGQGQGQGQWQWHEERTMRALYKEQGSAPGQGEWEDLVFEGRRVIDE